MNSITERLAELEAAHAGFEPLQLSDFSDNWNECDAAALVKICNSQPSLIRALRIAVAALEAVECECYQPMPLGEVCEIDAPLRPLGPADCDRCKALAQIAEELKS